MDVDSGEGVDVEGNLLDSLTFQMSPSIEMEEGGSLQEEENEDRKQPDTGLFHE